MLGGADGINLIDDYKRKSWTFMFSMITMNCLCEIKNQHPFGKIHIYSRTFRRSLSTLSTKMIMNSTYCVHSTIVTTFTLH